MLLKKINSLKGNDTRRQRALVELNIIGDAERNDNRKKGSSFSLTFNLVTFPIVFILYTLFTAIYVIYLIIVRFLGGKCVPARELLPDRTLNKLHAYWSKYPLVSTLKLTEAVFFTNYDVQNPSLEVGVHTGHHSLAIHDYRNVTVGLEYLPDLAIRIPQIDTERIFQDIVSADVCLLPIMDETFASVISVHSIDDMERPAAQVLGELYRVLRKGGQVCFSLFSAGIAKMNMPLEVAIAILPIKVKEKMRKVWTFGFNNLYEIEEWYAIAKQQDFSVESIEGFIFTPHAYFFALPFRFEGVLWNLFNLKSIFWIPCFVRKKIAKWGLEVFNRQRERLIKKNAKNTPMNYFIKLRKGAEMGSKIETIAENTPFTLASKLFCIRCSRIGFQEVNVNTKLFSYTCEHCGFSYPVINNVLIAHNVK